MKIDRKSLALVVPVDREDGATVYVHIAPLAREAFEQHYKLIGQTLNHLYTQGLGVSTPRLAYLALKEIALAQKIWPQTEAGLLAEMHRGATVLAPNESGAFETFLWADARGREILADSDAAEVEAAIVFFTVASAMHTRKQMADIFETLAGMWEAQQSSLTPSEYANSLRTPIAAEPIGEKAALSSIPR